MGIEYVYIDKPYLAKAHAETFAAVGFTAVKHYAEHVEWQQMQKGPNKPIDFQRLDNYVREFQKQGFTDLVICLKPHSKWGSKSLGFFAKKNASPKPQYVGLFEKWIAAVVERYDGDGDQDMPGLRYAVKHLEIGSEFSTYQPEPVDEYLDTLGRAYRAAHKASRGVKVAHAALLTTPANLNVKAKDYKKVIDAIPARVTGGHGYADIQALLDRPDIFDVLNVHNLGDPYEIEHIVRWLNYETKRRGYSKQIIISDITSTSFAAWGPATNCSGDKSRLAFITPPAVEADRCRLADFFHLLVDKDPLTLNWVRQFVAEDAVKKVIVAADQGVSLINLAFTTDLPLLTGKFFKAGAGLTAWSGFIEMNIRGKVLGTRPIYHTTKRLLEKLHNYEAIRRVQLADTRVRLYEVKNSRANFWVGWVDAQSLVLPTDKPPQIDVSLPTVAKQVLIERVGHPVLKRGGEIIASRSGKLSLVLSTHPVYISPQ